MSSYYDTMQVCKKWGHVITDYYDTYPSQRQDYCDKCGSKTTTICEYCKAKIRGYEHFEHVAGGSTQNPLAPLNCYKCGKPYPWRNKRVIINSFLLIISPAKYIIDSIVKIFRK